MEKTAGSPMLLRLALGKLTEPLLDVEITLAHLETQPTIAAYLLAHLARSDGARGLAVALPALGLQPDDRPV